MEVLSVGRVHRVLAPRSFLRISSIPYYWPSATDRWQHTHTHTYIRRKTSIQVTIKPPHNTAQKRTKRKTPAQLSIGEMYVALWRSSKKATKYVTMWDITSTYVQPCCYWHKPPLRQLHRSPHSTQQTTQMHAGNLSAGDRSIELSASVFCTMIRYS